jgi:hypothetical protein
VPRFSRLVVLRWGSIPAATDLLVLVVRADDLFAALANRVSGVGIFRVGGLFACALNR